MEPPNDEKVLKDYLKSLPIWNEVDVLSATLDELSVSIRESYKKADTINQRVVQNLLATQDSKSPTIEKGAGQNGSNCDDVKEAGDLAKNALKLKEDKPNVSKQQMLLARKTLSIARDRVWDGTINSQEDSYLALQRKIYAKDYVYGMRNKEEPWVRGQVTRVIRRPAHTYNRDETISFKVVRTLEDNSTETLYLNKYEIAVCQNHRTHLQMTKRVIAGHSEDNLKPGLVGQYPDEINHMRYLILFDDGSADYHSPEQVFPIFGQTDIPWNDIRRTRYDPDPNLVATLRYVLSMYPRRDLMCYDTIGESVTVIRGHGAWEPAVVVDLDDDIMKVRYSSDGVIEGIHRISARLVKDVSGITAALAASQNLDHFNSYIITWMQRYHGTSKIAYMEDLHRLVQHQIEDNGVETISSIQQKAKKSTMPFNEVPRIKVSLIGQQIEEKREVTDMDQELYDSLKSHRCNEDCLSVPGKKTELDVEDLIEEFMYDSDLKVPLLLGWKRELKRVSPVNTRSAKRKVTVAYTAPCGKIFIQPQEIRVYLRKTGSKLDIDYFSFDRDICLQPEVPQTFEAIHFVPNIAIDKETGKPLENKAISLLNIYDEEQLPVDFIYNNKSIPHPRLKANNFSHNEDFKSGCDCENDCHSRNNCECHTLNDEFHGSKKINRGTLAAECNYSHKRLQAQVSTGLFECNSFCQCSSKCSNRVVQNGMRFRLQVYKTLKKGWGVRTLDDIPVGSYICTYAAEILDDADQYGDSDMYYADLDYISVLEAQKLGTSERDSDAKSDEGFEPDDEEAKEQQTVKSKRMKVGVSQTSGSRNPHQRQLADPTPPEENDTLSRSSVEEVSSESEVQILNDYMPRVEKTENRYPHRKGTQKEKQTAQQRKAEAEGRQMFRKIHDLLSSRDYTLDARVQGNVGRFFNHSCDPNAYVQNVFIESHDLRFPNVAFFSIRTIKAGSEVTWNYNYTIGSIPGRRVDCECKSSNCKGRIL